MSLLLGGMLSCSVCGLPVAVSAMPVVLEPAFGLPARRPTVAVPATLAAFDAPARSVGAAVSQLSHVC